MTERVGRSMQLDSGIYVPVHEKDWQKTLVEAFEFFGWSVQHVFPLQTRAGQWKTGTTAKGWPDLVCLRRDWIVGCEVKGLKTRIEPKQIEWCERFAALAQGCGWILRPTDDWQEITRWIAHPENAPRRFGWPVTSSDLDPTKGE